MIKRAKKILHLLERSPFQVFLHVGAILLGIGVILHIAGLTFLPVDQLYCRDYLPWSTGDFETPCSIYRAGDDIFENDVSAREINYLQSNPYQQSYSERLMNGTPLVFSYGSTPYTPFKLLTRVLSSPSSANFAGLLYLFVSFLVGYFIARLLRFPVAYSLIFGALSIPLMFMGLIDAGNMSLLSYGFVALGMLLFYQRNHILPFVILTFLGSLLLLLGAMYQHYIYTALSFLLLGLLLFDVQDKRKFFVMMGSVAAIFLSTAMILSFSLERHLLLLLASQKFDTMVEFWNMIKIKGYTLDPLAWTGYHLPLIHRHLFGLLGGETGSSLHSIIGSGIFSPGPVYLVLIAVGLTTLLRRYRGYLLLMSFWFLYSIGVISLLLSIVVGDPFASESSMRATNLFFLLGNVAVVAALHGLITRGQSLGITFRRIATIFFGYVLLTSFGFLIGNYILLDSGFPMPETFYIGISSALGIVAMLFISSDKYERQRLAHISLIIGLLLVPLGRLVLGAAPSTFSLNSQMHYFPVTAFEQGLREQNNIIRTAMITSSQQGNLHEATPLWLNTPTVTAYVNPIFKEYSELYQYHRLLFENASYTIGDFGEFTLTTGYISNNLTAWRASTSTVPLPNPTKRFLQLTETNAIIASNDLIVSSPEWEQKVSANNLSLWVAKQAPPAYQFTTDFLIIPNRLERLDYVLQNTDWDPAQITVLGENPGIMATTSSPASPVLKARTDGYRLFQVQITQPGILSLPVTYTRHWKALFHTTHGTQPLQTIQANYAFLGVILPPGEGTVEIRYDDSPNLRHWTLRVAGLGLLVVVLLFLQRQRKQQIFMSKS